MEEIKDYIIHLVLRVGIYPEMHLLDALDNLYAQDDILRALSELVMENKIRRYEYMLEGEHTRRCFYMLGTTKLMF